MAFSLIVRRTLVGGVVGLVLCTSVAHLNPLEQTGRSVQAVGPTVHLLEARHHGAPNPHAPGWLLRDNQAYIVDEFHLLRTDDGGRTWLQQIFPGPDRSRFEEIHGIMFAFSRGWLSTSAGLWQSDDSGATWRRLIVGGRVPEFADSRNGWLRTDPANNALASFYRTHDSGQTWIPCSKPASLVGTPIPVRISFISPEEAWAIGMQEMHPGYRFNVQRTLDGGCTWEETWSPGIRFRDELNSIFFRTTTDGWMGGNGSVYHSSDGGRHWRLLSLLTGTRVVSIYFSDPRRGWLMADEYGQPGGLFATTDAGYTWIPVTNVPNANLTRIPEQWNRGRLAEMLYRAVAK